MALDFFTKKKSVDELPKRDLSKAAAYFKHAEAAADSRSHDYAIEMYLSGLKHDPDNVKRHDELREVAKRRKVAGGKPGGFAEKLFKAVGDPISRLLYEEMLWSKNPIDDGPALRVMEYAVEAVQKEPELQMAEVALWAGEIFLEMQRSVKVANKAKLLKVCELFEQIVVFDKGIEACRMAMKVDPADADLHDRLRNLETEQMMVEGRFGPGADNKEGDFRRNIKDAQKQRELEQEDALSKADNVVEELIQRHRQTYQANPKDLDLVNKFVKALLQKEGEETESEALTVLQKAFDESGQYKFRVWIGDIRMLQMQRKLRAARQRYEENKEDSDARKAAQQAALEVAEFELAEYTDRAKAYPTDMKIRFELGRRYFYLKQYDEATSELQKSQSDPKYQAVSLEYLGRAYQQMGLLDVAIESLRKGVKVHPELSDRLGMEMHYTLMDALEQSARETRQLEHAVEASKIASQILQANIKYRDIRERMTKLRDLIAELRTA